MMYSYTYKLYPTKTQIQKLEHWSNVCRAVYNVALQQRWEALEKQGKWLTYYDQQNQIPELRAEFDWIEEISADCLRTSTLKRLDTAIKRWSKQKISKKPKYKKKNHGFWTLEYGDSTRFKLLGNKIRLEKLGKIKIRGKAKYIGKPKICQIFKEAGNYYISIVYDCCLYMQLAQNPKVIGIDVGVTDVLTDSAGNAIASPRFYVKSQKRLRKLNKALARKKNGSNRHQKAKIKLQKQYFKIKNQRKHFLHQVSYDYTNSHGVIVMENLKISNMVKNKYLSKSILDQGWGLFRQYLTYKLAEQQGELKLINPAYTSQICHICEAKGLRNGKTFTCATHGQMDADVNAAKNILARYEQSLKTSDLTIVETEEVDRSMKRLKPIESLKIQGG